MSFDPRGVTDASQPHLVCRNSSVVMRPLSSLALNDPGRNLCHVRRPWNTRRLRRHLSVGWSGDQAKRRGTRPSRWLCLAVVVAGSLVTAGCLTYKASCGHQ
jgi:hypothetical protein